MKNKILSVIVSLAFVLSMLTVPAVNAEETDYSTDIAIMNSFGFLSAVDTASAENYVTRSEFTALVDLLLDIDVSTVKDVWFEDVDQKHVNFEYVSAAAEVGIVHGTNGRFYPDKTITYLEAIVMLVNALGGERIAEYEGEYPSGYLKIAEDLKLNKNIVVGVDTDINVGMAARLLLNAGKAQIITSVFSGGNMKIEKGNTLFWAKHRIDSGRGILAANQYTSVDGGKNAGENGVRIGDFEGKIYYSSNVTDYLGYNVEYYYREENDDNNIYYIEPADGKNKITNITEVDSFDDDKSTLSYYVNQKNKKVIIKPSTAIVYNGVITAQYYVNGKSIFNTENGEIKLIDNNSDGSPEVISIVAFEDYFVSGINVKDGIVYDMYGLPKLDFRTAESDNANWIITDASGKIVDYSELAEKDILSVAMSFDKKVMRAIVSKTTVKASVTGKYITNDDKVYVLIGDTPYEVLKTKKLRDDLDAKIAELKADGNSNPSVNYTDVLPAVGTKVTAYVGYLGKISAIETSANLSGYGFIIKIIYDDAEEDYSIRMLTSDGSKNLYNLAKKVCIDGVQYSSKNNALNTYIQTLSDYQMVIYKLNDDDEITMIDTERSDAKNSNDVLRAFTAEPDSYAYYNTQNALKGSGNSTYVIADELVAFTTPANDPITKYDLTLYGVGERPSGFGSEYQLRCFSSSGTSFITDCVQVVKGGASSDYSIKSPYMLVSKVVMALDEDDIPVLKFNGYRNGNAVSYNLASNYQYKSDSHNAIDANDVRAGDIIRFTLNAKNEISYIVPIKRMGTVGALGEYAPVGGNPSYIGWFSHTAFYLNSGFLQSREGNYIGMVDSTDKLSPSFIQPDCVFRIQTSTPIYYVTCGKGGRCDIEKLTVSDIGRLETYQATGEVTETYCILQNASLEMLIVYEQ